MTTPTLHGPPLIRRAMDAARTAARLAGATPVGCTAVGKRISVQVSTHMDLEAISFAHPGCGVEGEATRYLEVVVDGQRVTYWSREATS